MDFVFSSNCVAVSGDVSQQPGESHLILHKLPIDW